MISIAGLMVLSGEEGSWYREREGSRVNVRLDGCEVDEESGGSRMWRRGRGGRKGEEEEEEEVE